MQIPTAVQRNQVDQAKDLVEKLMINNNYVNALILVADTFKQLLSSLSLVEENKLFLIQRLFNFYDFFLKFLNQIYREVPPSLDGIISTIIWALWTLSNQEYFEDILEFFTDKYGNEYVKNCTIDKNNKVDENIKKYLSREKPSKTSIKKYLQEICKTYKVSKFNLLSSEFI